MSLDTDYGSVGHMKEVVVNKQGWQQVVPRRPYVNYVYSSNTEAAHGTDALNANHFVLIDKSSTNICYSTTAKILYSMELSGQVTVGSFELSLGLVREHDGTNGTVYYFDKYFFSTTDAFNMERNYGIDLSMDTDTPMFIEAYNVIADDTDFSCDMAWIGPNSDVEAAAGDLILSLVGADSDARIDLGAKVFYGPR